MVAIGVFFGGARRNQLAMMLTRGLCGARVVCHAHDGGLMSSSDSSFVQDNYCIGNTGSVGSNCATRRLIVTDVSNSASQSWFERHDGPTLLIATAIYASWLFLLASHRYVPWWITVPLAGYVVQWHFSLQHEAIHSAENPDAIAQVIRTGRFKAVHVKMPTCHSWRLLLVARRRILKRDADDRKCRFGDFPRN